MALRSGTGVVTVSRRGGRVLELRPGEGLPNLLGADRLGRLEGGDRLWPAPELELFYERPPDPATWRLPPGLEPGSWTLRRAGEGVRLARRALGARFERRVRPLASPPAPTDLPWAGYEVEDRLEAERRWSAWHLVMVPAPAEVFVRGAGEAVVYYEPAPRLRQGWLRAEGVPPRWKVGFDPPPDGRVVLAALGEGEPGPLVVLAARLPPGGTYVDTPPGGGHPAPVQVYSSPGDGFCELEVHAPLETRALRSVVAGFWGPRADRLRLVQELARPG